MKEMPIQGEEICGTPSRQDQKINFYDVLEITLERILQSEERISIFKRSQRTNNTRT